MKARVLPHEEWNRLRKAPLFPGVSPEDVDVVVVEDGGQIVASVLVMRTVHLESLWIDGDSKKNPGVVRAMKREMYRVAREKSAGDWALVCVERDTAAHLRNILGRLHGIPLPVDLVMLPLGG